jgi:hypothetical protein
MGKKPAQIAVLCGVVLTSASVLAQGERQDGQWEIKATMEMAGMPMEMPPVATTECVSKEDAKDPQRLLPKGDNPNGCKVTDYKVAGNRTTYSLTCDGPPTMSGTGEIIYAQDTYSGALKMEVGGQSMTVKYAARRLGDCIK